MYAMCNVQFDGSFDVMERLLCCFESLNEQRVLELLKFYSYHYVCMCELISIALKLSKISN